MLRTFRACFWTCLTLLLWSHIHSHTHLFSFSNQAVSCGCPPLSIWVFVVIYSSHLSDTLSPWVIFPLSVSPLQLFSPSQLLSRQCRHPSFPPPWDAAGWDHGLHWDRALGWVELTPLSHPISQDHCGFSDLHQLPRDPLLCWCERAQPFGLDALHSVLCPKIAAALSYHTLHNETPSTRATFHLVSAPTGTCWAESLRRETGWPLKACVSPGGNTRIMGLSLTAGPSCDLASGGSTQVFPVWSGTLLRLSSANKASFVKAGDFQAAF